MGRYTFSLPAEEKSSFVAGESVMVRVSIAAVAYTRVSRRRTRRWVEVDSVETRSDIPAWKALTEEQTLCGCGWEWSERRRRGELATIQMDWREGNSWMNAAVCVEREEAERRVSLKSTPCRAHVTWRARAWTR